MGGARLCALALQLHAALRSHTYISGSKETHATQATLTDADGSVVHTAFATTSVPLYILIAMTPADLGRVKQLTVSYFSDKHDSRVATILDVVERTRVSGQCAAAPPSGPPVVSCNGFFDPLAFFAFPAFRHCPSVREPM